MENHNLPLYACLIEGMEVQGKNHYPLIDPSTSKTIGRVTIADSSMIDSALNSAHRSFQQWRALPVCKRTDILHAFARRIRGEQEALARLLSREVGKPVNAARDEVSSTAHAIDYFAEEGLRLTGQIPLLGHSREQVQIVREPVGVVVSITPFNYPLSTLACKVAPALAVGCTVVAKPDEHTPLSTLRLARLALEAGLPPGAFNVLTGPGDNVGRLLVEHSLPRLITFTGSTEVGKEIQSLSARWVRKTILELGGHCPAIVCSDAPWKQLLNQIVRQSFKNSGQYCYRISRIYLARDIYSDFLSEFLDVTSRLRIGPATDPEIDLGPLNNPEVLSRVCRQVETAVQEGARIEIGASPLRPPEGGFYYPPTVLSNISSGMSILKEEVFGPVVMMSPFDDFHEAIENANATPYGLAAYLFTNDLASAFEGAGRLEAGSIWVNRIHQAYPEAPFGGTKESGLGREKSRFGIEEYTELKTIYLSY